LDQKKNIENTIIGAIILMKKNWFKKPLPSFCTSNFDVIKIILIYAKIYRLSVLIECTSNQVNQFGGYSGLKPKEFYKKIILLSKKIQLNRKYIIFGADHLGPLPWKNLNKKNAFKNAEKLLKSISKEKFEKIHLDTTIVCGNEKKLNLDKVRSRFFELFKSIPKKKLKNIYLVAGSEVPYAGGGDFKENISKLKDVQNDYSIYNSIINQKKSKKREFALVIEPGMSFTNDKIFKPNFKNLKNISKFSKKKNIFFEAHSTDYQRMDVLKKLVKSNFKFLKVGPELTFKYHQSLKLMLDLEKRYTPIYFRSNLNNELNKIMKKKNKYWKDYYKGSTSKINFLKFNSLLDRVRYYWNHSSVDRSKEKLFKNIDRVPKNYIHKNLITVKKTKNILKKYKMKNSELIVFNFLRKSLSKYYKACGFKSL